MKLQARNAKCYRKEKDQLDGESRHGNCMHPKSEKVKPFIISQIHLSGLPVESGSEVFRKA